MRNWVENVLAIIVTMLSFSACDGDKQLFEKIDVIKSGIDFENKLTPTEDFNIIDYLYFYNGGGVAVGDINGDELPDIFFSGNQVKNKLYLNKGDLKFEDITDKAGVAGNSSWNTGSVMADVNGDGLLDIYVCAVVGLKNLKGRNELYLNNGNGTFSERASEFGLDFESYSSSAAFLDYDLDGDLDMYLLNHAVHTPGSFAPASARNIRTYESGGKLMRNDSNKFVDVSAEAKIYGGLIGYGLGVAVSDLNVDGYPDIYVSNDFHEDDYLYINNGDGSFREVGNQELSFTSRFSMGNDVADINHDGFPDFITLDMLPEDEKVLKRSESDVDHSIEKMRTTQYGYSHQFMRNTLQINQGDGTFVETALMSNVAATDWSWAALFCDFDQDGHQDLFISNGIPFRPNDLDYIKYVSNDQIVNTIGTTKLVDKKALSLMPSGKVRNYIYKGSGGYAFQDKSVQWLPNELTCSSATAVGDLDNDGDLDIVVNNINDRPGIYINEASESSHYLKIKLKYRKENLYGIGARVYCYQDGVMQLKEMYTVRGFQSSSEPILHFGAGANITVDSIKVVWPDGMEQTLSRVKTDQTLVISPDHLRKSQWLPKSTTGMLFEKVDQKAMGLDYRHVEDDYSDFDRLKLLPLQQSDRGPATAVGDLNNDGKEDIYFGGSKRKPGQIFIQTHKGFTRTYIPEILRDSIKEDVDAVIEDFNKDGKADLFIGSGGADYFSKAAPLLDSYYTGGNSAFEVHEIPDYYENASVLKPFDFDKDGDVDLFVGSQSVSNDYGKVAKSCLLINTNGKLTPVASEIFENLGMVTDAVWDDYNKDGQIDLIVVGEWMEPVFLKGNNGKFEREDLLEKDLVGLWQSLSAFDIDKDGDTDYILGNWGLNSKFKASKDAPLKMYYGDIDENGQTETIVAIEKNGRYYPMDGFDLMASQIASLRKSFTSYETFAGKSIDEIFSKEQLKRMIVFAVHELGSGYLKNENGKFSFVLFPPECQLAPILAQLRYDFDSDGSEEVLLGGNYFGVQPFHSRFGSFSGALVKSESEILDGKNIGLKLFNQSVRHFNVMSVNGTKYLLVTINDGESQCYKLIF
jgi:enediyne biosynthesis protein E4